jgi:hypothetical protein
MRYVIAGGGAYGTHYLKKIQIALEKGKIDLDEIMLKNAANRFARFSA